MVEIDVSARGGVASAGFFYSFTKGNMAINPGRREFLASIAAVSLFPLEEDKPELILHNANIVTVNSREPRAQAVAISRGRILAVGSDADLLHLGTANSRKIDLAGKTVLPGFIDAHSHPAMAGVMNFVRISASVRSFLFI